MKYYVADAFTDKPFGGNPAGVCLVEEWPADETLQKIAAQNNLAETAFVAPQADGYRLRWFTPEMEMDLCGHATLATAFILSRFTDAPPVLRFHTMSGLLTVEQQGERFVMDFPSRPPVEATPRPLLEEALGVPVQQLWGSRDLMAVLENQQDVLAVKPDYPRLLAALAPLPDAAGEEAQADAFALVITAPGDEVDFVSRFFAPGAGVPEDPVTGSSHSTLIPYWAKRLGKTTMVARQLSPRGGTLYCEDKGARVSIAGSARLYLTGEIFVE